MKKSYQVKTPEDFTLLIEDIFSDYKSLDNNLVITLKGDLGAGKTAFTKKLGEFLGIEEVITSPTFNIMRIYEVADNEFTSLVHIDAYRIENLSEAGPLKLESFIGMSDTIVCIEWPEMIADLIPEKSINLSISIEDNEERHVTVSSV